MIGPDINLSEAEKEARLHAWSYFAYHAQQRQTVFNFYLLLTGGCIAGFASTLGENQLEYYYFRMIIGLVLAVASFLFWRLDQRNARLVKIAEEALGHREMRLSQLLQDGSVQLMKLANSKISKFPLSKVESFRQIYALIFSLGGFFGGMMTVISFCRLIR
jgi:hypothetical protein